MEESGCSGLREGSGQLRPIHGALAPPAGRVCSLRARWSAGSALRGSPCGGRRDPRAAVQDVHEDGSATGRDALAQQDHVIPAESEVIAMDGVPEEPRYDEITETEWAYLAGLIDGEGSVYLNGGRQCTLSPALRVTNTNPRVMEWLRDKFFARVTVNRRSTSAHKETRMALWTGDSANYILSRLYPYLVIKTSQASLLLNLRDVAQHLRARGELYQKGKSGRPFSLIARAFVMETRRQPKELNRTGPARAIDNLKAVGYNAS